VSDPRDDDGEDDVGEALAAIRVEYAADLPRLVAALAEMVARAGARSPEPEAARACARAAAHMIRGTAGSYGFHAVGEAAGEVEDALDGAPAVLAERMRALTEQVRRCAGALVDADRGA
jgi:chemotaxis protein histidine kinase CheA